MSIIMSAIKNIGKAFIPGMAAYYGYEDYRTRVNEGENSGSAFAKASATQAMWFVKGVPQIMMGKIVADILPGTASAISSVGLAQSSKQSRAYQSNFGGHFSDTQNAYTMRQRGVQAIEQNRMNTRSILGSEARTMYRYANQQ